MTQDEIIRMAREAGLQLAIHAEAYPVITQQLERFAALVAAHERERLEPYIRSPRTGKMNFSKDYEMRQAVLAEREACVQACDITSMKVESYEFDLLQRRAYFKAIGDCGAAIRARGTL